MKANMHFINFLGFYFGRLKYDLKCLLLDLLNWPLTLNNIIYISLKVNFLFSIVVFFLSKQFFSLTRFL